MFAISQPLPGGDEPERKPDPCGWCITFRNSAAGTCNCKEACGIVTCPMRDPDNYTPPPVPRFK